MNSEMIAPVEIQAKKVVAKPRAKKAVEEPAKQASEKAVAKPRAKKAAKQDSEKGAAKPRAKKAIKDPTKQASENTASEKSVEAVAEKSAEKPVEKKLSHNEIIELVQNLSNNFTTIISRNELHKYKAINWGGNGVGDRWAKQLFNYTSIYNFRKDSQETISIYSENDDEKIDMDYIETFQKANKRRGNGIIGILPHGIKQERPADRSIKKQIENYHKKQRCVVCGSNSKLVSDHKNDLYNDPTVLNIHTQKLDDFQSLCNHCNLQKREICKKERATKKLYSALNIPMFAIFKDTKIVANGKFIWENDVLDEKDINCKVNQFWYDPPKFMKRIITELIK